MKSGGANASKNRPRGNILLCPKFKSPSLSEWYFRKGLSLPEYTWSGGGKTRETTTDQVVWLLLLGGWMVSWSSYYLNPKQHSVLHLGQPKCKSKSRVTGHTKKPHCSSPRNLIIQCGSGLGHQLFHLSQSFFFSLLPPTEEI